MAWHQPHSAAVCLKAQHPGRGRCSGVPAAMAAARTAATFNAGAIAGSARRHSQSDGQRLRGVGTGLQGGEAVPANAVGPVNRSPSFRNDPAPKLNGFHVLSGSGLRRTTGVVLTVSPEVELGGVPGTVEQLVTSRGSPAHPIADRSPPIWSRPHNDLGLFPGHAPTKTSGALEHFWLPKVFFLQHSGRDVLFALPMLISWEHVIKREEFGQCW